MTKETKRYKRDARMTKDEIPGLAYIDLPASCLSPTAMRLSKGAESYEATIARLTTEIIDTVEMLATAIARADAAEAGLVKLRHWIDNNTTLPFAAVVDPALAHAQATRSNNHKLDNDAQVFFYEQDFYVLSNFSSFNVLWKGLNFGTSEQAYHWEKFEGDRGAQTSIWVTRSAHDAFKMAESMRDRRCPNWDDVKVGVMRCILRAKVEQHEYVRRKLLATGNRELIEDSWRDDYWGWGPSRDGQNMLGKLWMEIRSELRALAHQPAEPPAEGTK